MQVLQVTLRTLAAAAVAGALAMAPTPANATRPVPGHTYTDQCNNFPGVQPEYELVGSGPYRENEATRDPNDCILLSKYPTSLPTPPR